MAIQLLATALELEGSSDDFDVVQTPLCSPPTHHAVCIRKALGAGSVAGGLMVCGSLSAVGAPWLQYPGTFNENRG